MAMKTILLACVSVAAAVPQQFGTGNFNSFNFDQEVRGFNSGNSLYQEETTPPVPILRQIQERNPDGSYTYGYESGDGTYKIETRYATGEVKGKYGYYDASGKLREVTYGAEPERGFEPVIEGVIVAPPTINPEPEFNAEPVFAEPEPAPVRRPSQPVRKTVVRRPRPQPAVPQQRAEQPRFANFQPSDLPAAPQQQARVIRPRPQPAAPQRTAPQQPRFQPQAAPQQPRFQPQQAVPQQPRFQPQQRFTPAAPQQTSGPLPSSVSFFNHPYIQDFDSGAGVFSYSYGK